MKEVGPSSFRASERIGFYYYLKFESKYKFLHLKNGSERFLVYYKK